MYTDSWIKWKKQKIQKRCVVLWSDTLGHRFPAVVPQLMTGAASCSSSGWVIDAGTRHQSWRLERTVVDCYVPLCILREVKDNSGGRKMIINNRRQSRWHFHGTFEREKFPVEFSVWQENAKNLTPSLRSETAERHDTLGGNLGFWEHHMWCKHYRKCTVMTLTWVTLFVYVVHSNAVLPTAHRLYVWETW